MELEPQLLEELKFTFEMFDKNGDGCITIRELETVLLASSQEWSQEDLQKQLDAYGAEGADSVSWEQFSSSFAVKPKPATDTNKQLLAAFKLFDEDNSGFVDVAELTYALTNLGGRPMLPEEVEQMLKGADTDKDGQLNYEEFAKAMASEVQRWREEMGFKV